MNKEKIEGLVRHLLTFGGGFAVASEYITPDQLTDITAIGVAIVGVVWSFLAKKD